MHSSYRYIYLYIYICYVYDRCIVPIHLPFISSLSLISCKYHRIQHLPRLRPLSIINHPYPRPPQVHRAGRGTYHNHGRGGCATLEHIYEDRIWTQESGCVSRKSGRALALVGYRDPLAQEEESYLRAVNRTSLGSSSTTVEGSRPKTDRIRSQSLQEYTAVPLPGRQPVSPATATWNQPDRTKRAPDMGSGPT